MNNEGLNALIAFLFFYFDIHDSLIGVHDSIKVFYEGCTLPWFEPSKKFPNKNAKTI
jgi:hypothetical protein